MFRILAITACVLVLLALTLPAFAEAPHRTRSAVVYGNDSCPTAAADEIVVCAREPESERFRIPKRFRSPPKDDAVSQAWGSRVATLEDAARTARPGSCSAVGAGGQTGCTAAMMRAWFAERRANAAAAADIP